MSLKELASKMANHSLSQHWCVTHRSMDNVRHNLEGGAAGGMSLHNLVDGAVSAVSSFAYLTIIELTMWPCVWLAVCVATDF